MILWPPILREQVEVSQGFAHPWRSHLGSETFMLQTGATKQHLLGFGSSCGYEGSKSGKVLLPREDGSEGYGYPRAIASIGMLVSHLIFLYFPKND